MYNKSHIHEVVCSCEWHARDNTLSWFVINPQPEEGGGTTSCLHVLIVSIGSVSFNTLDYIGLHCPVCDSSNNECWGTSNPLASSVTSPRHLGFYMESEKGCLGNTIFLGLILSQPQLISYVKVWRGISNIDPLHLKHINMHAFAISLGEHL